MYCLLITSLLVAFLNTLDLSNACLDSDQTQACKEVFNTKATEQSCCAPMNQVVEYVNECNGVPGQSSYTCEVSDCVIGDKYGVLDNDDDGNLVVNEDKVIALLERLDNEDPSSKPLNQEIRNNCINGQFKDYDQPSPRCESLQMFMCSFVAYMNGCPSFDTSTDTCRDLGQAVEDCKPVLADYVKQSKSCS